MLRRRGFRSSCRRVSGENGCNTESAEVDCDDDGKSASSRRGGGSWFALLWLVVVLLLWDINNDMEEDGSALSVTDVRWGMVQRAVAVRCIGDTKDDPAAKPIIEKRSSEGWCRNPLAM
jgi:hypothetical protein